MFDNVSIESDQQQIVPQEQLIKEDDDQPQNQNLVSLLEKNYKHFCQKQNTQQDNDELKSLHNSIITQQSNPQMYKFLSKIVENEIFDLNGTTRESAIHLSLQKQYQNVFFSIVKTFMNVQVTSFVSQNQPYNYDYNELIDTLLISSAPQIVIVNQSAINFQRLQMLVQKHFMNANFIQNIVYLDFSNNPLSDSGCILILTYLSLFQSLKYLILKQTQAQNSTVRVLCEQTETKGLYEIDLSENPGISRGSYQELLSLAQNSYNLTKLSLENCGLNHQQLSNLKHLTLRNKICKQLTQDLIDNCLKIVSREAPSDDFQRTQSLPSNKIKKNDILQKLSQQLFKQQIAFEIVEKVTEQHESYHFPCNFDIASSETMGRRKEMEDVQVIIEDFHTFRSRRGGFSHQIGSLHQPIHTVYANFHQNQHYKNQCKEVLICLFDGHGGRSGSEKCAEILPGLLADCLNNVLKTAELISPLQMPEDVWEPLFTNVFLQTDEELKKQEVEAGTTAVIVLLVDNLIIQANCGDSRAILVRNVSSNKKSGKLDITSSSLYLKRSDRPGDTSKSISTDVEDTNQKQPGVTESIEQGTEEILALEVDQHVTMTSELHSTSHSTYNGNKPGDTNEIPEQTNDDVQGDSNIIPIVAQNLQISKTNNQLDQEESEKIDNIRQYKQLNKILTSQSNSQLTLRLSQDHKPSNPEEKARIEQAGGYVTNGRVLGVISVSRSFGDFNFKPLISVVPFVSTYWLSKDDYGLIVGCDGVWDVINDEKCALIMLNSNNAQASSIKIRDEAYKAESGDNISVVCCKFIKSIK